MEYNLKPHSYKNNHPQPVVLLKSGYPSHVNHFRGRLSARDRSPRVLFCLGE